VKSKWFIAMTLLGPAFMVALIVIPAVIAMKAGSGARIEVIDKSGVVAGPLIALGETMQFKIVEVPATTNEQVELDRIKRDEINGFIVVPKDVLDGGLMLYRGDNASGQVFKAKFELIVRNVVVMQRMLRRGIAENDRNAFLSDVNLVTQHSTGEAEGTSATASFLIAYALAFILYMVLTLYGVGVMRSVVQEKTSRVMEFLVGAVKPQSLMSGKILGVGGAALIQITVWLSVGALALAYRETVLGWFGINGAGAAALPPLAFTEISVTLLYFILGYFFYSSMYAAVGAMVSSEQDTQQVQMPVTMLLVIGVMCIQVVSNAPRGSTAAIMTMIPLWSPMLMPMRFVLGGASLADVGLSLLILLVSTVLVARAAAKIYRVGVLLYGKRPSLKELIRWLRY
jgi:ABC-2 type transport system permease protein